MRLAHARRAVVDESETHGLVAWMEIQLRAPLAPAQDPDGEDLSRSTSRTVLALGPIAEPHARSRCAGSGRGTRTAPAPSIQAQIAACHARAAVGPGGAT